MHVIAAKAVCFGEALRPDFKEYAEADDSQRQGPGRPRAEEGFRIVSGGTDTHLMLVDLRPFEVTGKIAQIVLDSVSITTNKNAIPFDPEKPFVASGLRLGTPAVTTRGMKEEEMSEIANLIARGLKAREDEGALAKVKADVEALAGRYPMFSGRKPSNA